MVVFPFGPLSHPIFLHDLRLFGNKLLILKVKGHIMTYTTLKMGLFEMVDGKIF